MKPSFLQRLSLRKALRKEFASSEAFMEALGWWVTASGFFLPGVPTMKVGTEVEFAFVLPSQREILAGKGKVERVEDGTGDLPTGVFIRFLSLTPRSQINLHKILHWQDLHAAPDPLHTLLSQVTETPTS